MIDLRMGDCLELMKDIPDGSVDCIITDPPYGILGHKIETGVNIPAFFEQCYRVLKPDSFIAFFGQQPTLTTWNAEAFKLFNYKNEVIWYKRGRSSPMNDMGRVFENITVATKGKKQFRKIHRPYTDVVESMAEFYSTKTIKRIESRLSLILKDTERMREAVQFFEGKYDGLKNEKINCKQGEVLMSVGKNRKGNVSTVNCSLVAIGCAPQNLVSFRPQNRLQLNCNKSRDTHPDYVDHPTAKPTALLAYLMELCTNEGETIVDPFMGGGATGMACVIGNRNFIGMEIDPTYFNNAQKRIYGSSAEPPPSIGIAAPTSVSAVSSAPKQGRLF